MRLLFDQNLSPQLIARLHDIFPGSSHVYMLGLERAMDLDVWEYAQDQDYAIVTRDADFAELSTLRGFPPKVLWIRRGNCTTRDIEQLLRGHREAIESLAIDPNTGVLMLF